MLPMMIYPLWLINVKIASSLMCEYRLLTTKTYFCKNVDILRGSYARQVLSFTLCRVKDPAQGKFKQQNLN